MRTPWEPHPLPPIAWRVSIASIDPARRLEAIAAARRLRPDVPLDVLRQRPEGVLLRLFTVWEGTLASPNRRAATSLRDTCEASGLHVSVGTWHHPDWNAPDRQDEGIGCISLAPCFAPCDCGCGGAWWTVDGYLSRDEYRARQKRLGRPINGAP